MVSVQLNNSQSCHHRFIGCIHRFVGVPCFGLFGNNNLWDTLFSLASTRFSIVRLAVDCLRAHLLQMAIQVQETYWHRPFNICHSSEGSKKSTSRRKNRPNWASHQWGAIQACSASVVLRGSFVGSGLGVVAGLQLPAPFGSSSAIVVQLRGRSIWGKGTQSHLWRRIRSVFKGCAQADPFHQTAHKRQRALTGRFF